MQTSWQRVCHQGPRVRLPPYPPIPCRWRAASPDSAPLARVLPRLHDQASFACQQAGASGKIHSRTQTTEVQLQNSDPRTVRDVTIIMRGTERKGLGCSKQTVQNHKVVYLERLCSRDIQASTEI